MKKKKKKREIRTPYVHTRRNKRVFFESFRDGGPIFEHGGSTSLFRHSRTNETKKKEKKDKQTKKIRKTRKEVKKKKK